MTTLRQEILDHMDRLNESISESVMRRGNDYVTLMNAKSSALIALAMLEPNRSADDDYICCCNGSSGVLGVTDR